MRWNAGVLAGLLIALVWLVAGGGLRRRAGGAGPAAPSGVPGRRRRQHGGHRRLPARGRRTDLVRDPAARRRPRDPLTDRRPLVPAAVVLGVSPRRVAGLSQPMVVRGLWMT